MGRTECAFCLLRFDLAPVMIRAHAAAVSDPSQRQEIAGAAAAILLRRYLQAAPNPTEYLEKITRGRYWSRERESTANPIKTISEDLAAFYS